MRAARDSESGSMSVELVLLTPVLLALVLLVVAGGRLAQARSDVDGAARDAARAASMARDSVTAAAAGTDAARATLHEGHVSCRHLEVDVDTAAFAAGGTVTASVSCTVELGDLTGLALPGTRLVSAKFTEAVDTYRGVR